MEVPSKRSQPVEANSPVRRARWRWRILFIKAWLIAAFLLVIFLGLGVTALMAGADGTLELEQRVYAFCVGAMVIFCRLGHIEGGHPGQSTLRTISKND